MRPVTATAMMRGRKMMDCTTMRAFGAISSAAAITSARQTGAVRKIAVQMKLLVRADQNTGSANMFWKLARPAQAGLPTPSHMKNAAVNVSTAGTRMMQILISSAGSANSHILRSGRPRRQRRHLAFLGFLAEQGLHPGEISVGRDLVEPDLIDTLDQIGVGGAGPERPGGEAVLTLAEGCVQVGDGLFEQGIAD